MEIALHVYASILHEKNKLYITHVTAQINIRLRIYIWNIDTKYKLESTEETKQCAALIKH